MPENFVPSYGIIKGRFKALGTNTFGLFFVSFNLLSKVLEKIQVASSHFSSIYENSPQMPWHEFEERIINIKWRGEYSINITNDIQKAIDYELKSKERTEEIIYYLTKNAVPKISEFFQNILQRPTGDKNVTVDLEIELVSQEEVEEVNIKRTKKDLEKKVSAPTQQQQAQDEFNLPSNSIVLEDKVLTRITEKTQRGQYFKELLGAIDKTTNEEKPIPATVEQVKVLGKNYVILTSIGPGIYCKSVEEDNVKVKKYEGEVFKTPTGFLGTEPEVSEIDDKTSNLLIIIGITAGTLILIALILMLLGFF
jgi:hypothetical protein